MSNQNPRTIPVTFPVSELDVVRQKLAKTEAILERTVRANYTATSPMDAANGMTAELSQWTGYAAVAHAIAVESGDRKEDYVLVGAI